MERKKKIVRRTKRSYTEVYPEVSLSRSDAKYLNQLANWVVDDLGEEISCGHKLEMIHLHVIISMLHRLFEVLDKNPIDECDLYSQYLQYYHLGRMSTVPGRYVDDGRLINEDCEDETDEELYEGEANGKSFLEILNSRAVHLDDDGNIIEKKDGDTGEAGVLQ